MTEPRPGWVIVRRIPYLYTQPIFKSLLQVLVNDDAQYFISQKQFSRAGMLSSTANAILRMRPMLFRSATIASSVALWLMASFPTGAHAIVLHLDALLADGENVALSANSYKVSLFGVANGGLYDAWNGLPGTVNGCDDDGKNCRDGFTTNFRISSPSLGTLIFTTPEQPYATALLALQNSPPIFFTLDFDEIVNFVVHDNPGDYADNIGGLSMKITPIPLPATWLLLLVSLAAIYFRSR